MATFLPDIWPRTDVANTSVSCEFACACTRNVQCRCFATPSASAKTRQSANTLRVRMPIDKGFDRNFATQKAFGAGTPFMKRRIILLLLVPFLAAAIFGQDGAPTPTPVRRRGWLSRILHPFSPEVVCQYKRSEEHTSELQSRTLISYAVCCLKKKTRPSPDDDLLSPVAGRPATHRRVLRQAHDIRRCDLF